jgi:putative ABC transport system permease protein
MRFFEILRHRLRTLFRRSAEERELEEELRFHAEESGRLVGVEQIKEECRDARGISLIENLARDTRYGLRLLARAPGFTAVAVITLALGIGMNSAIFSVVDAVMLRPLPYPEPQRLVALWETNLKASGDNRNSVSPANLADYRQQALLQGLAAWSFGGVNLGGDNTPERLTTNNVSYNFFDVLGVQPALGRPFLREEDQPERKRVVIISYNLWRRSYGLDPSILNRKIMLDGVPHQVVGVMPEGFAPPYQFGSSQKIEAFVPFGFTPDLLADSGRGDHEVRVIARLRPGVTLEQAIAGMTTISERLARTFPQTNGNTRTGMCLLGDDIVRAFGPALRVLLGAVGLILLIACVNVANLLLVRGGSQRREIAVRYALGARRSRICGELLVQSAILAAMGCVFGVLLGAATRRVLVKLAPAGIPSKPPAWTGAYWHSP